MTNTQNQPRWMLDICRYLNIRSQFILSGNVRDIYPWWSNERVAPRPLSKFLRSSLNQEGYQKFIAYDPIDGFTMVDSLSDEEEKQEYEFWNKNFGIRFREGKFACSLIKAQDYIGKIVNHKEHFITVFVDYASRIIVNQGDITPEEKDFFSFFLKLSYNTYPHVTEGDKIPKFNSIFWICDKENDFPSWFFVNNPRIRPVVISKPDFTTRYPFVASISKVISGYAQCTETKRNELLTAFAEQTEGMYNSDILAITQLARREKLEFSSIAESVRRYTIGVSEDPWARLNFEKISRAGEIIEARVKGQSQALVKGLDIIKRSVTGMSGAIHAKVSGKPRGVMFLAGPTGTGKTEFAKAVTELIFGDERAYIRFDMSEFSAENADQRLLGAPPGYIGYDAGGELTNAVREKPFSVILFDEIEKANPIILDKFLQILEDGRLTDGTGNTVYFSECLIIFTSNLGIYKQGTGAQKIANVSQNDTFEVVEKKVRDEIENYFKLTLGRPEILNRIGDNIIVFDFIRENIAAQIYRKLMTNILETLEEKNNIQLTITKDIYQEIGRFCMLDLSNGGRGIGNRLETVFLNPLSRSLFEILLQNSQDKKKTRQMKVTEFKEEKGYFSMKVENIDC